MKKIACLLLCLTLTALGDNPRVAALLKNGDAKNNRGNLNGALGDFLEAEKVEPNNAAVILRIARQYSDLIDVTRGSPEAEKTRAPPSATRNAPSNSIPTTPKHTFPSRSATEN